MEKLADMVERHGVRFIREQHLSAFEAEGARGQIERIEVTPPALEKLQERRVGYKPRQNIVYAGAELT